MPGLATDTQKGTLGKSQADLYQLEERMDDRSSGGPVTVTY